MKPLSSERISALPIRLLKRIRFDSARVSWKPTCSRLVSLMLIYALLLQLVPPVVMAAGPPPKSAPAATGASKSENAGVTLGSLLSRVTGTIESSFSAETGNSLPSVLPSPTPANGIAVVRHAPSLNGNGRVEGSLRQLTGESVTLNGGAVITNDLQVPGIPSLVLNGPPVFGGTIQGTGSSQPTNYQVMLNGGTTTLGHLVNRTDPITLVSVSPPPASQGTRAP